MRGIWIQVRAVQTALLKSLRQHNNSSMKKMSSVIRVVNDRTLGDWNLPSWRKSATVEPTSKAKGICTKSFFAARESNRYLFLHLCSWRFDFSTNNCWASFVRSYKANNPHPRRLGCLGRIPDYLMFSCTSIQEIFNGKWELDGYSKSSRPVYATWSCSTGSLPTHWVKRPETKVHKRAIVLIQKQSSTLWRKPNQLIEPVVPLTCQDTFFPYPSWKHSKGWQWI